VSDSTSTQEVVVQSKKVNQIIKQTDSKPKFKTKKGNFRDSDFEFDGIIESEGVLEMMADGYGFLRLLIIIILHHQMTFIYQRPRLDYSDLKPRY
jgi:transcription termination factor Rho